MIHLLMRTYRSFNQYIRPFILVGRPLTGGVSVQSATDRRQSHLQTEHVRGVVADLLQQTVPARLPVQRRRRTLAKVVIVHAQRCKQNNENETTIE